MRTAVIAGASGLVGGHCLPLLLDRYDAVVALGRRTLPLEHPKLRQAAIDFAAVAAADLPSEPDVFCALGTTIRKAGSQEAFRRVDFEYSCRLAEAARAAGARQFALVSSIGADARGGNFYLKVKGETEDAIAALGFPSLHVFQPSILDGDRAEARPGERVGLVLTRLVGPLLVGGLARYRATPADAVARAMVAAARHAAPGRHVYRYPEIVRLSATL